MALTTVCPKTLPYGPLRAVRALARVAHHRTAFALPLNPHAIADAMGVALYELPRDSPAQVVANAQRAFYRPTVGRRAIGHVVARGVATTLGFRFCLPLEVVDELVPELLAPGWALQQASISGALADLPWTPTALILERWGPARRVVGM